VLELQPDLVIIYQGGNDVMPREVAPECYAEPSPFLGLDPRRQIRGQSEALSPFALYRFLAVNSGWMRAPAEADANLVESRFACGKPAGDDLLRNIEANPPTYFERNIRSMIGVAQAHGVGIVFATYAYNPHSPYAYPYWRAGVEEDNAVTMRVAEEVGSLLIDYAALAPTDESYWNDSIHMTSKGNQFQAETFARFLDEQGVIPNNSTTSSS
jgi:lysophospholipase L1-like esterase